MKIYNTLTRKKQEFRPQDPKGKVVKMYVCGVTVYDECHIGHARSLYIFEVMRRYLNYRGFDVKFIRNITDIDDKIINRANELKVDWRDLVRKYIDRYYEDLTALDIPKAVGEPRATENIPEMIKYIKELIKKGYAYVIESGVYFRVRKFKDYGKLSGQNIDDMRKCVRIEALEGKQDPLDFALWKRAKEGEPFWESPWGKGRPGWHIECSVMSQKYLKTETLDIHGGGRDLIFPHHENERAQSEALTNKPFANYWIHHGLLTINGQKMAKSLGNFVTIQDVLRKYPADILKMFYLGAHYSSPLDFSWEKMEETKQAYERITILLDKLKRKLGRKDISKIVSGGTGNLDQFRNQFIEAMNDDFNTAKALAVLFDMINRCNKTLESSDEFKQFKLSYALDIIKEIADVFCLTFPKTKLKKISEREIKIKIELRSNYRKQKKFKEADKIRKELETKGIILEDTKEGTVWRRKI